MEALVTVPAFEFFVCDGETSVESVALSLQHGQEWERLWKESEELKGAVLNICDHRRGGFVNHPGPFNQKTELLVYMCFGRRAVALGERGRQWAGCGRRATRGRTAWAS